ncbi:Uncharacterised protein [Mycobacteroides abscessus subsp. abscessus]|nr:Uncharacterised protein [Mycobacteroides abscessus subsp. abscessus]
MSSLLPSTKRSRSSALKVTVKGLYSLVLLSS